MAEPLFPVPHAAFLAAATKAVGLPAATLPEVAFAGRSNVGKSSLLNALLSRKKLVRTSRTPGCTRQINLFDAKVKTKTGITELVVTDLPGYGFAARSKGEKESWGPMIEGYLLKRDALCGLALLVDVRRGVESDDQELVEFWAQTDKPLVVVATKLDKIPGSMRKPALAKIRKSAGAPVVGFSSESGVGRDELWMRVLGFLGDLSPAQPDAAEHHDDEAAEDDDDDDDANDESSAEGDA
ncbi:ribosome biogenesis GTP-binding protein YihA/YsxC [soil metagenome]